MMTMNPHAAACTENRSDRADGGVAVIRRPGEWLWLPHCAGRRLPYTGNASAHQRRGFDSPKNRRNSRAGYPMRLFCCAVRFASMAGRAGRGVSPCRFLFPVCQPRTSCHPRLTVGRQVR